MCPMFYFHTIRFVRSKIRKMDKENARTRNGTKLFFFGYSLENIDIETLIYLPSIYIRLDPPHF